MSEEIRFLSKVSVSDGCWLWTGGKNENGYGAFYFFGVSGYAHRYSQIKFNGPIPEGHEVDHICRNPSCVKPSHLRAIPISQNRRKGQRAEIKVCRNGHDYEIMLVGKEKQRSCRECKRQRLRNWRSKVREQRAVK